MTVLFIGALTGVPILAVLLYLECLNHALTRRELDIERRRREVAEHVLNRINTAHLPPALVPLGRPTYTLDELAGPSWGEGRHE